MNIRFVIENDAIDFDPGVGLKIPVIAIDPDTDITGQGLPAQKPPDGDGLGETAYPEGQAGGRRLRQSGCFPALLKNECGMSMIGGCGGEAQEKRAQPLITQEAQAQDDHRQDGKGLEQ